MATGALLGQSNKMSGLICDGLAAHLGRVAMLLVVHATENRVWIVRRVMLMQGDEGRVTLTIFDC